MSRIRERLTATAASAKAVAASARAALRRDRAEARRCPPKCVLPPPSRDRR
ncbi:hypothetical protein M1P56_12230 [Streptomyces sp. HU2014]|uniref:Uncharacterized protein n=1 Tax=Streptomyces albireticuli TaxID=1940 RepID=A0A1Z2LBD8_9ACTN|nr:MULTISPECIES: hypothetical protein [Streptomyces]ARZ71606.1 hypothetical protein SMD11_6030 [Streptomyces albireticuli]UQI45058.1 hypothetical protein M1P56_12230 [Streptomyces sp. HU2014]